MSASTPLPAVRITHFPAQRKHLTITAVLATILVLSSSHRFAAPLRDLLLAPVLRAVGLAAPSLATVQLVQDWNLRLLGGAHALEVVAFAALRLRPHGISLFSTLALKWLLCVACSGMETWKLWAATVKAEERKRA